MYDGVFQVLRNSSSLELAVESFHLLMELGKVKCCLPFVLLSASYLQLPLRELKIPWSAAPLSVDLGTLTKGNINVNDYFSNYSTWLLFICIN
jgi:hypothetical protein